MSDLEKRMGAIENRSTALHAEGEGERRWSEENIAACTLEAAKSMVAQLRLDIDFAEAFVPGPSREQTGVRDSPLRSKTWRDGVPFAGEIIEGSHVESAPSKCSHRG